MNLAPLRQACFSDVPALSSSRSPGSLSAELPVGACRGRTQTQVLELGAPPRSWGPPSTDGSPVVAALCVLGGEALPGTQFFSAVCCGVRAKASDTWGAAGGC